jgi:orotate phosphoribosyltransferase
MGVLGREMPLNGNKKLALTDLIKEKGIVFKHVKLFSKVESEYYYDIKNVEFQPEGIHLLGELLLGEIVKYGAKSVGGLEMGAVSLATAVVMKSAWSGKYELGLNGFFIRKETKQYGLEKRIEGNMIPPVVIVDDVLTSGKSVMGAIQAVNNEGHSVKGVVFVIDREEGVEEERQNLLKQNNIKYSSLFKHSDFKSFIEQKLEEKRQNQGIKSD